MDTHNRLNRIFRGMKSRCYNKNTPQYKDYGGKVITICDEWLNSEMINTNRGRWSKGYDAFRNWAFANGYKDGLTIDRIDCNKGYSPKNCRWVTMKEQCNNKTNNHLITYKGKTQTLTQWCEELKLPFGRTRDRLYTLGWSVESAFETSKKTNQYI